MYVCARVVMCVTQFNNNNNAHTQRPAQAVYTCSSCTSADARELVRVRSRPWVGQRSSGCEWRTVIMNPSAFNGCGALMAADTGAHHQTTRRTVRIHVPTSSGGLSWRGGCSADGSDTCMSGGYVAEANGCGGCSTATQSYIPT